MLSSETIWKKAMTKKTRRRYTAEFKAAAVARLDEPGERHRQLEGSVLQTRRSAGMKAA
jgi:transposase-like protein